ncbi:hypothetical protein SDC9_99528 [bioreactor metagenome]|uniref:Uncharacterized protein n=1 Tax=bioreactor metagenome TaxID=1076179 RepID=A0A645AIL6_9ZZZZ|nr:hypothetical protein [Oscillibacter sp.]
MNYIEEELRRQAAAFAALLGGGTVREKDTAEKDADRGRMQAAESEGDSALRRCPSAQTLKRDPAEGMAEWNRMLRRRSAQTFRQAANALGLTDTEVEAAAAERTQSARTGQEQAGARMGWDENRAAAIQTETSGADTVRKMGRIAGDGGAERSFRDFAETVFMVDGGMSAGELSRTFQRDARRYDGGYPLY